MAVIIRVQWKHLGAVHLKDIAAAVRSPCQFCKAVNKYIVIISSILFCVWFIYKHTEAIKMLLIVPTDAHYYKIVEMLKHLKLWHLLRQVSVHAGTIIREQSCA